MTVWRHTNVPEAGYADVLSGAIERVQRANPDTFWPVSEGLQLVASDYSGQHRGASHEIYAFLITTADALEPWVTEREAFRRRWLPDNRRISFKQLREPMRRRAFPHFLHLTGHLRANLITIMVDQRVGSFMLGGPAAIREVFDDCFAPNASDGTVEKVFRLATFVSLIQAGLRREDQRSRWVSDHDETLDTFDKREGFARMATYLTVGLTGWRRAADQDFYTTEAANLPEWMEDLAAIPDLSAGAFAKLADVLPLFLNQPTWTVRVTGGEMDWRARVLGDWLAHDSGSLRHVLLRLAPDETGTVRASAQRFLRGPNTPVSPLFES